MQRCPVLLACLFVFLHFPARKTNSLEAVIRPPSLKLQMDQILDNRIIPGFFMTFHPERCTSQVQVERVACIDPLWLRLPNFAFGI